MTTSLLHDTSGRIESALGRLDRELRGKAVQAAAYQAVLITDGRVDSDLDLAVALCRVAAQRARPIGPPGAGAEDPQTAARDSTDEADRVDLALVSLRAALQLVVAAPSGTRSTVAVDALCASALELSHVGLHALLREAAYMLVARALELLPEAERGISLGVEALASVRAAALGETAAKFVQTAALQAEVSALGTGAVDDVRALLCHASGPDDMLVRHHALTLIPRLRLPLPRQLELIESRYQDESEHVRQGVVRALLELAPVAGRDALGRLAEFAVGDGCPAVLGFALVQLAAPPVLQCPGGHAALLRTLEACCASAEPVLHRAALHAISTATTGPTAALLRQHVGRALQQLIDGCPLDIAELAATEARKLALVSQPGGSALLARLSEASRQHREGRRYTLALGEGTSEHHLHWAAFVTAALDLPLTVQRRSDGKYSIRRGERRGFRFWKLVYELLHRGPDKRQSHLHTRGRMPEGGVRTVPLRQAEVTPTRVPGERRALLGQSWGCFLPRVDDLAAACAHPQGALLLTPFGRLQLRGPRSWLRRCWLRLRLVLLHPRLCDLRDRALLGQTPESRSAFTRELGRLGFGCEYSATAASLGDFVVETMPRRARQYLASLPLPLTLWLEDALSYVVSPSGNTAWHLSLVVWLLLVGMLFRSRRVHKRFARSRRLIPLSIGGWGSRGKSGTERLKSALFQSLHLDVVSKTTGCEAMLILARRGQSATELFLYRPYDKATIWEQETAVGYAQRLGAQVFLWECMALNPEFVDILNREWMQDDITTVTNAYPDHEDIMGPTGEDVARVVGRFVPDRGLVFSSEDQMQAIVRESANARGSRLIHVDELCADLLPRDLLARFPYQEHPRNVALALRLAEELGIDRLRALVDIADNVVPDLGVLKTFPKVGYETRTLRFSNGMSANERAGFLSNWNRLGFADHCPDDSGQTQLVLVLNNRADRVARSRVFAELCARDVSADWLVVIGTNGSGMLAFLRAAALAEAAKLAAPEAREDVAPWLEGTFRRLAIPREDRTVVERLRRAHVALGGDAGDASLASVQQWLATAARVPVRGAPSSVEALRAAVAEALRPWADQIGGSPTALQVCFPRAADVEARAGRAKALKIAEALVLPWRVRRELEAAAAAGCAPSGLLGALREAFFELMMDKIVVLENSEAKGDEVLDFVFRIITPGHHGEVLGCQNIKGTGLDFIYRFISLQKMQDFADAAEARAHERPALLAEMLAYRHHGLFDCQLLLEKLDGWRGQWQAPEAVTAQLESLKVALEARRRQLSDELGRTKKKAWWHRVLGWLEPLVDNLDGVGRRKRADATMSRLINHQIDVATASEQLRETVARQKGGWLARDIEALLATWRQRRHKRASTGAGR